MMYYYLVSSGSYSNYSPRFMVMGQRRLDIATLSELYSKCSALKDDDEKKYQLIRKEFFENHGVPEKYLGSRNLDEVKKYTDLWDLFCIDHPYSMIDYEELLANDLVALGFSIVAYEEFNLDQLPLS